MRACVAPIRSLPVLSGFTAAMVIASAVPVARAAVLLQSGFDLAPSWASVTTVGSTASVATTGGNPGGYADLRPALDSVPRGLAALESTSLSYTVANLPGGTFYLLQADVAFFSGLAGGELVPVLRQGISAFTPITGGIPMTSGWARSSVYAFALADFRDANGNSPSLALARVGIGVRIAGGPVTTAPFAGRYGVDNVQLDVVPAPSSAGVIGVALLASRRRRR